jgi:hypothetical protein
LSDYESAALWGLYVPPHGGVAIRSTFGRLTEAFVPSAEDEVDDGARGAIFVGRVRYADYEKDWIPEGNTLWPFVHKRRSFDFENELRAVVQNPPSEEGPEGASQLALRAPSAPGRLVPVNLAVLIDSIFVSPVAPGWFAELVASVCAKYDLDKPVEHSNLSAQPVY